MSIPKCFNCFPLIKIKAVLGQNSNITIEVKRRPPFARPGGNPEPAMQNQTSRGNAMMDGSGMWFGGTWMLLIGLLAVLAVAALAKYLMK
ncbi:MAG: hypothetical protein J0I79_15645 [Mesorhizobium sp.]|jgi:hypothetical protein|uniref:hypothetical protein n=1 Tax=Mesorhizobium TaxID=68287 RepID=UPI000FCBB4F8|nr:MULTISPECIES: hypothetical protein [Mesorhizobium]MBN9219382.1 hypothetical protein [Mesorhizobium sp.]RUY22281.1 hypothetical protein EN979_32345 [Mesorhizobium sp. M7A.F.Ca.US.001.04.2.1]RUY33510.1 hypothetical protein EN978_36740 [Mesorhizobium sp. M7A.F.Ca.US.001.04.1.1]